MGAGSQSMCIKGAEIEQALGAVQSALLPTKHKQHEQPGPKRKRVEPLA
jgi:hypothetical protein